MTSRDISGQESGQNGQSKNAQDEQEGIEPIGYIMPEDKRKTMLEGVLATDIALFKSSFHDAFDGELSAEFVGAVYETRLQALEGTAAAAVERVVKENLAAIIAGGPELKDLVKRETELVRPLFPTQDAKDLLGNYAAEVMAHVRENARSLTPKRPGPWKFFEGLIDYQVKRLRNKYHPMLRDEFQSTFRKQVAQVFADPEANKKSAKKSEGTQRSVGPEMSKELHQGVGGMAPALA